MNRRLLIITVLFLSLSTPSPFHLFTLTAQIEDSHRTASECDYRTIHKVIDGDTVSVRISASERISDKILINGDEVKVRLIGIDTPETVHPMMDVEWFGKEATRKLRGWVEGKTVCLKMDRDRTQDVDKYGRLLRYLWLNNFLVNAELVKQGYAFAYTKYPFQYLEDFRKYARDARKNNRGLWNSKKQKEWEDKVRKNKEIAKTCGYEGTICPEEALNYISEVKTVRFFVRKSYDSGKAIFLNSKNNFQDPDNFTAVIFTDDRHKFPKAPDEYYWGRTIDVTGKIKEHEGRAEIILENPSQIKILKSE
ncbi:MAG: thermonuclease family protein [Nitrospirae bacterium]|nr:thermonuclease family protein [Nitrospirota bacterium]